MDEHGTIGRTAKIGLPLAILLGGIGVASLFRPEPAAAPVAVPTEPRDRVVWRERGAPAEPEAFVPERPPARIEAPPGPATFGASASAIVLTAVEPDSPPPSLGKSFPREAPPSSSRWGVSMGIGLPGAGSGAVRTHKIADGDTLPTIAAKHLGDAERWREVFEANRDVLPNPEMLPIGRELKIPAKRDR